MSTFDIFIFPSLNDWKKQVCVVPDTQLSICIISPTFVCVFLWSVGFLIFGNLIKLNYHRA